MPEAMTTMDMSGWKMKGEFTVGTQLGRKEAEENKAWSEHATQSLCHYVSGCKLKLTKTLTLFPKPPR